MARTYTLMSVCVCVCIRALWPYIMPGHITRKVWTLCLRASHRFYRRHKGCCPGKASKQTPTTFYCCKFFIRPKKNLLLLFACRSCWTLCIDTSHGYTWCGWAMARAYPAIPRSCRIWIIKPSCSRRLYSRPWRPIRINWLRNWKSIRIRSQKDFAIRRVWLILIGEFFLLISRTTAG